MGMVVLHAVCAIAYLLMGGGVLLAGGIGLADVWLALLVTVWCGVCVYYHAGRMEYWENRQWTS